MKAAVSKLLITGFMGSGKTTVGRLVADKLSWTFIDLDEAVESAIGTSIGEIFASGGESEFRQVERQTLLEVLEGERVVVATGGGTLAQPAVVENVQPQTVIVWLDVPLAVIERRLGEGERQVRPLYRDFAAVSELYERRRPSYQAAGVRVEIEADESPEAVADRVVDTLAEFECATS